MDFAWSSNGYVYHTKLDNAAQIPLGTLQRTGDNILPLVIRLVGSSELANVSAFRSGNLVFFDFLGAFIVRWSELVAGVVNIAVIALSVFIIWQNMTRLLYRGELVYPCKNLFWSMKLYQRYTSAYTGDCANQIFDRAKCEPRKWFYIICVLNKV